MQRALFIGRFQPFHNAHLEDIREILEKHGEIIIGIGSSQEKRTKDNPFSYSERKEMVSKALKSNKIKNFKIYPVPDFYDDAKWTSHIREKLPKFDVVYSGNEWTLKCLANHGIKTKKINLVKNISSTRIRKMIAKGKSWEMLVPKEINIYIKNIKKR